MASIPPPASVPPQPAPAPRPAARPRTGSALVPATEKSGALLSRAEAQGLGHMQRTRPLPSIILAARPVPPPAITHPEVELTAGCTLGVAEAQGQRHTMEDALDHRCWGDTSCIVLCDGHGGPDAALALEATAIVLDEVGATLEGLTDADRASPERVAGAIQDAFMSKADEFLHRCLAPLLRDWRILASDDAPVLMQEVAHKAKARFGERSPEYARCLAAAAEVVVPQGEPDSLDARLRGVLEKYCGPIARAFLWRSSGTTALAALRLDDRLYIINLGDSRALWLRPNGTVRQISIDHTAATERQRLERYAIPVSETGRIGGLLIPSRSLGDARLNGYVKRRPQVICFEIPPEGGRLVLGCDGIFERLDKHRAAMAARYTASATADAEAIRLAAERSGTGDNQTVAVVRIPARPPGPGVSAAGD
jgi:serine/threonine protein phosphatase PrpC